MKDENIPVPAAPVPPTTSGTGGRCAADLKGFITKKAPRNFHQIGHEACREILLVAGTPGAGGLPAHRVAGTPGADRVRPGLGAGYPAGIN
jgi:hypothetical protein